jgi:hypothetical protein
MRSRAFVATPKVVSRLSLSIAIHARARSHEGPDSDRALGAYGHDNPRHPLAVGLGLEKSAPRQLLNGPPLCWCRRSAGFLPLEGPS